MPVAIVTREITRRLLSGLPAAYLVFFVDTPFDPRIH